MTETARYAALVFGVLALAISFTGAWLRNRAHPEPYDVTPAVGRSRREVTKDPLGAFSHVKVTTDEDREVQRRATAAQELDALLGGLTWPGPFRQVVVHALAGALPAVSGEEGPPWHLVLGVDGEIGITDRLKAGRPGVPDGYPANEGRKALHVVLPEAGTVFSARQKGLGDLLAWLSRKLVIGPERIHFAGERPGFGAPPPAGVSRETLFPLEWRHR